MLIYFIRLTFTIVEIFTVSIPMPRYHVHHVMTPMPPLKSLPPYDMTDKEKAIH